MKRIIDDIKNGQLKQAYLLYGEETYLIKQYRDKLKDAMLAGGDAMNVNRFQGKDVSTAAVIDMAETLPFFAEKRILVLENTELFKSGGEQLAEYMKAPAESASFVFVETAVDKRSRLFKAVSGLGVAVEFARQDETTLKRWIVGILKKEEKQIEEKTLNLFLEKTGDDMENIRKELEKLICYCMNKPVIEAADVEAICTKQIGNQIFEMMNAIAVCNQKKALQLYYDLLALREPPPRILFLLSRQFNLLLQVKELMGKNIPQRAIGEKVGLQNFVAGKYMQQARAFSKGYLKQALTDCVDAEQRIKTGAMDAQLSLEVLIVKYSSTQKRGISHEHDR